MADKPLLCYPICNELSGKVDIVNADSFPDDCHIEDLFERMVIIQPLDRNMYEAKALETFEIPKDCVEEIRCHVVRRKDYTRIVIVFHDAKEARATALKCNRTTKHPNVCAVVAQDFLTRISKMEEEIKSKSCTKEMSQIVLYADYKTTTAAHLKFRVTSLFARICPNFHVKIDNVKKGMASIKLPSLSHALSAEFAFCCGMIKQKTYVILDRDSLIAQHDLAVRVSLIGHPEEELLGKQKSICDENINNVTLAFCNTLGCEACLKDPPERNHEFLSNKGIEEFSSCGESEELFLSDEPNTSELKCSDESSVDGKMCSDESSSDVERRPHESSFDVDRYPHESSSDAMTCADDTNSDSTI